MTKELKKLFRNFPTENDLMKIIMHTSSTAWKKEFVRRDLEFWLANFKGEVLDLMYERRIALWLLSHFTFYNQDEVTHLCKVVYNDLIHNVVSKNFNLSINPTALITDFFNKTQIIAPEEISGSGGFIAYFFRQINDLPMNLFNSIDHINASVENIIIIDDVILTASEHSQIHRFLKKNDSKHKSKKIYLLTLVSSLDSIKHLQGHFDNIEVVTAITLDSRDKCFNTQSYIFSVYPELLELARKVTEHYGERFRSLGVGPLGYKNGQYTFGFFYNTPDNTLPIFWGKVAGWGPIMKRYHKIYRGGKFIGNERFI
jgi:hypothetical protein